MLKNYLQLEAGITPAGRWPDFYSKTLIDVVVDGQSTKAMVLSPGDGGAKVTARKLQYDGLGHVRWNTQRLFVITDAGRAAAAGAGIRIDGE